MTFEGKKTIIGTD